MEESVKQLLEAENKANQLVHQAQKERQEKMRAAKAEAAKKIEIMEG